MQQLTTTRDSDEELQPLYNPLSTPLTYSSSSTIRCGRWCGRSISFSKKELLLLSTINAIGFAALATFGYFLTREYQSLNPEARGIATYQMSIAAGLRILAEVNVAVLKKEGQDPYLVEKIMNYFQRFSLEGYEVLWNILLNISSHPAASQAVMGLLQGWSLFNIVGDAANVFKSRQGHRREMIQIIDERDLVNPRLFPSPKNVLGQSITYLSCAVVGGTTLALGEVYNNDVKGLEALTYYLGSFLIASGVGYASVELFLRLWKRYETRYLENNLEEETGSLNSGPRIPWKLRLARTGAKMLQEVMTEFLCVSSLLIIPKAYFPLSGFALGAMGNIKEKRFAYLSKEVLEGERAASFEPGTVVKRTAVRVNQLSTFFFFVIMTAVCIYALINPTPGQVAVIATLLGSFLAVGLLSRWLYHSFRPGENGRIVNEIAYRLLHNIYGLLPLYFGFSTVSAIESANSTGSSPFGYAAGLAATVCSGTMLAVNQTREYSEFGFTPPLFRTLVLYLILSTFAGSIQR